MLQVFILLLENGVLLLILRYYCACIAGPAQFYACDLRDTVRNQHRTVNELLRGAAWCCVVLRGATWCCGGAAGCCGVLRGAAGCCGVLRGAAGCCVMLRDAAWCCGVLLVSE